MKSYWRDKKTVYFSVVIGLIWLGAGLLFYFQQRSLMVGLFWGSISIPWLVKAVYDLRVPYLQMSDTELVVRRSPVSARRTLILANIGAVTRVERKEIELVYLENGKRNLLVIMVNELNAPEISRFVHDLRETLKSKK